MSKKFTIAFLFLVIILIGLTGCDPSSTCDPGSLQSPDLVSPDWREVVDGSAAVLQWSYPDTCEPDDFEIILSKDRDYTVIEHTQLVSGTATTYTPPTLDIAEEYFWRARAKVGSTYGPYSSERRSFFTLPHCTAAELTFPPALVSPLAGDFYDNSTDSLEWEWQINSCIPESYRIEVSRDSGFVDDVYNGATGSPGTRWGFGSTPPAATMFFWRVSAFSDGVWGSPSATWNFTTVPMCPVASLADAVAVSPLDNETVNTLTPEFIWSHSDPSCAPEGYHFQSSETADFSTIFIDGDNPTSASYSFLAGYPYNDCQEYYWRVAVVTDSVESAFTTPRRFVVDSTGACACDPLDIPIPELVWPEPIWTGAYDIVPLDPALEWINPGPCIPDGYQINVSDQPEYIDPALDGEVFDGLTTTYTPPVLLQPASQYWWRVFATYDGNLSDSSNHGSFFTEPECGAVVDMEAPDLISPSDGEVVDTITPHLRYHPGSPGCIPDGYFINLQTDPDFLGLNLLGEIPFPATAIGPEPALEDCRYYYWYVQQVQDSTYGPESDHYSFFTDTLGTCPPPAVPGTAKKNTFCREGTYSEYPAVHTFEIGDPVLAIARNWYDTYLKLIITDKDGKPYLPIQYCWAIREAFDLDGEVDRVDEAPPKPAPECSFDLGKEDCKASGGTYDLGKSFCDCP